MENNSRHPLWFWLPAFFLGWSFDVLFWGKTPGVSFPIFLFLCLVAGLLLARILGVRLHRNAFLLMVSIVFFSAMFALRSDPLSMGLNLLFSAVLLGLLAHTAVSGDWIRFALLDYLHAFLEWLSDAIGQPLFHKWGRPEGQKTGGWRSLLPIFRGFLLAMPFLVIFSCLFASADPVFSKWLGEWINLEHLPEYAFRLFLVLFIAYGAVGTFIHAFRKNRAGRKLFSEQRLVAPWLGSVEALIVLALVNILFLVFVGIQFRYLFGGQANIHLEGFTYSEYAVRGFWELIMVALISLGMFLGLHASTSRTKPGETRLFSALSMLLMALVQVILYSALTRLGLYEEAYGFSRLRTYTHVFLIWTGILFLAMVFLEMAGRLRYFTQLIVLVSVGFVVSLNALNVDAFIVRQNFLRADGTDRVDFGYLASLSADSIPALRDVFLQEDAPADVLAGVSLACYRAQRDTPERSWQELRWPEENARVILSGLADQLASFEIQTNDRGGLQVYYEGQTFSCRSSLVEFMD